MKQTSIHAERCGGGGGGGGGAMEPECRRGDLNGRGECGGGGGRVKERDREGGSGRGPKEWRKSEGGKGRGGMGEDHQKNERNNLPSSLKSMWNMQTGMHRKHALIWLAPQPPSALWMTCWVLPSVCTQPFISVSFPIRGLVPQPRSKVLITFCQLKLLSSYGTAWNSRKWYEQDLLVLQSCTYIYVCVCVCVCACVCVCMCICVCAHAKLSSG